MTTRPATKLVDLPAAQPDPSGGADVRETRTERRKRETEERILRAALDVFVRRGYDGATTAEMARVADVAAGTFYLYFKDKRAAYERVARRTAEELLARWGSAIDPEMGTQARVRRALEITADFWRERQDLAHLLLDEGHSLGREGHLRFVDQIMPVVAAAPDADAQDTTAIAFLIAGLGLELGRWVCGRPESEAHIARLIDLAANGITTR